MDEAQEAREAYSYLDDIALRSIERQEEEAMFSLDDIAIAIVIGLIGIAVIVTFLIHT